MAAPTPAEERRQVLHYAAGNGRADIVSLAIEQETADDGNVISLLSSQDEKGTALHEACRNGHVDVVRLLLLRGAPPDVHDANGKAPFQVALAECPAAKFDQLRAAFEAELFKRCATGDTAGAESLARGGLDLKEATQAGYSPWAWASLFDATATAERMEAIANGQVDLNGTACEEGEPSDEPEEELQDSVCEIGEISAPDLLLWPPVTAFSLNADVFLSLGESLQVEVRIPPLDMPAASMLFEKLQHCLQAVAPVGEFLPKAPVLVPVLQSPCDCSEAAETTHSTVDLWLDASMNGFQVKLAGDVPGRVQLMGGSLWALSQAVEQLRQLLLLHRRPSLDSARLPALCLRGPERQSSVLMDLWSLSCDEQSNALQQLARWQIRRFWVPVPVSFGHSWLQDVFEARRTCTKIGAELVPVIRPEQENLVTALAQFQGCRTVGLQLPSLNSRSAEQCSTVWPILRSAGLEVRLMAMLSLEDLSRSKALQQVNQLCKDLNGRHGPAARTGLLLECSIENSKAWDIEEEAVKIGFAHGISVGIVIRSVGNLLPAHVWHAPSSRASIRATALWQRTRSISQVCGLTGCSGFSTVMEVPVFGAPWAGCGTAWRPSWCLLSGFFAAGLAAPEAQVDTPRLLQLLPGQFFGDASASDLAQELWNAESTLNEDFLRSLLALLSGELPRLDAEGISNANAWYAYLSDRRQRLRSFLEGHPSKAEFQDVLPGSALLLASALVGIEWLRFACRVFLLLAKHASSKTGSEKLRSALQALPPAKQSDVRNGFLALLHRTIHGLVDLPENGWWEEGDEDADSTTQVAQAEALWSGGLRLGAALDFQPWRNFASGEKKPHILSFFSEFKSCVQVYFYDRVTRC